MNGTILEVIIIGAGHAGLSASYYLKQLGLEHVVFERGKIGESWRSQRWDSFTMNTANRLNVLPGSTRKLNKPDGFCLAEEFVRSLEEYVSTFQLPVTEDTNVLSIEKPKASPFFIVTVSHDNEIPTKYSCWQVIIASGTLNEKKIPAFANLISPDIKQLHTCEYRNPAQIADGAVLVTGSAQSGCQVAEDLMEAGRKVFLSTSLVPRVPRRYRGKDIMDWLIESKFMDVKTSEVTDPQMLLMKVPLLSGIGEYGHTLSLQYLAQKGAILLGTMEKAKGENVSFQGNALAHVKFANDFSVKVKAMIDEFILKNRIQALEGDVDDADVTDENIDCDTSITSLNLGDHDIKSILWATGFNGNFNYIKLPVLDSEGQPKHQNGIAAVEGLYFLGCSWLRSQKSNLIYGIKDDAGFISNKVYSSLR